MGSFILATNVVLPIFLILVLGKYLKKIKIVDEHSINIMNKITFRVFMGILMFVNIYNIRNSRIDLEGNFKYLFFPAVIVFIVYFLTWLIYLKPIKNKKEFAVMVQGVYRGNFALFGLPVAESIYGQEGASRVAMLLAVVIPIYNILAVLTLEYYSDSGKKTEIKKLLKAILKNPLIIGVLSATVVLKLNIVLPKAIYKTLYDLSKIATPLSFVVLGASLEFGNMLKNFKKLISVNIFKLIINPMVTLAFGYILKFSGVEMVALLAMSACPTAVSSFSMAKEMNIAGDLAGEIVASTTVLSIFTMFLWIVLLKNLGII